jgi:class 3 adenylate cyclase
LTFEQAKMSAMETRFARVRSIHKVASQWEYDFYRRYIGPFGLLCAGMQLLFFAVLKFGAGYEESFFVRVCAAVLLLFFSQLPPPPAVLSRTHKIYIEFTYAINLPILFSINLILNNANVYWTSSMVFCGLIYGLLAQPLIGFASLLLSIVVAIGLNVYFIHLASETIGMVQLAFLLCTTMFTLAAVIRAMMQLSFTVSLELRIEKSRLEQVEENFRKLRGREEVIMRFVRPSVLTEIALGKDPLAYLPRKVTTSILFVDMRNYTDFSERSSQAVSYKLLNDFFTTINTPIFAENGEVDKIMGDAVMATFHSPESCIRAAVGIRRGLSQKNRERVRDSLVPIKFGTGIAYGEVLSGNFGSIHKLDRTIIGDIVNVGARLEQLTKSYRVDVLATESFMATLPDYEYCRYLDRVLVKGKSIHIKIYEIFQHNHPDVIDFKLDTKARIAEAIACKENGLFDESLAIIRELIKVCPIHRFHPKSILDPYLNVMETRLLHEIALNKELNDVR